MTYTHTPLGKPSPIINTYESDLLVTIPRKATRDEPNATYRGHDLWIAYELSWLDPSGKPNMAIARFIIPANTEQLTESKSMKHYLHSFNQTVFEDKQAVEDILVETLSTRLQANVLVEVIPVHAWSSQHLKTPEGNCLDHETITLSYEQNTPEKLEEPSQNTEQIKETVYSELFKSNCKVTGQPDWATVVIHYEGPRIPKDTLLRYLMSFRQVQAFHEPTIEKIYQDIYKVFKPNYLRVEGFFTRRGGVTICPKRSSIENDPALNDWRVLPRQ
jgi:7-cyano-7-deazaguanine reductase